jgi:hypothetical protein
MNINIEKIENGYIITIDGKKTFCDVPEAICGVTSEWVLEECKRLEGGKTTKLVDAQYLKERIEMTRRQQGLSNSPSFYQPQYRVDTGE